MQSAASDRKTPYAYNANSWVAQKIANAAQMLGHGLPCQITEVMIGFVTVQFNVNSVFNLSQVTMPVVTSRYSRAPLQVGDLGRAIPTGVSLGQATGLSSTSPNLGRPFNLTGANLAFEPLGNKNWAEMPNGGQSYWLMGVNGKGVVIQDQETNPSIVLSLDNNGVTIKNGSGTTLLSVDTSGNLHIKGNLFTDDAGIDFLNHYHSDPQGGDTGLPTG